MILVRCKIHNTDVFKDGRCFDCEINKALAKERETELIFLESLTPIKNSCDEMAIKRRIEIVKSKLKQLKEEKKNERNFK